MMQPIFQPERPNIAHLYGYDQKTIKYMVFTHTIIEVCIYTVIFLAQTLISANYTNECMLYKITIEKSRYSGAAFHNVNKYNLAFCDWPKSNNHVHNCLQPVIFPSLPQRIFKSLIISS